MEKEIIIEDPLVYYNCTYNQYFDIWWRMQKIKEYHKENKIKGYSYQTKLL